MQTEAPVAPEVKTTLATAVPPIVFVPGVKLRDAEKIIVERTVDLHKGNKKEAAKTLGISRSALYAKLKRFGLPV